MEQPPRLLPPAQPFDGPGVYALYYAGEFPPYAPIASADSERPIYVGKAVPPGAPGKGSAMCVRLARLFSGG
ncbi:MAG: Eco29kI family restriction endonuclease [Candidatus Brocadiia bacterium]